MRMLVPLAFLVLATPAAAVSLPMANGYGALDAPRDTDPLTLGQLFCNARIAGDMSPLEKFYAPKLTKLLQGASVVQWQTYPDTPQSCAVSIVNGFDDTVGVIVEVGEGRVDLFRTQVGMLPQEFLSRPAVMKMLRRQTLHLVPRPPDPRGPIVVAPRNRACGTRGT